MENPQSSYQPPNPQVELAKKRNRAAAERTLMAWIRTSLSLISFGFGIDRIVAAIKKSLGEEVDSVGLTRFLGLSLIALGIFAMVAAAYQHQEELRHIQQNQYVYTKRRSLALIVARALIVIGLIAFIGILIQMQF